MKKFLFVIYGVFIVTCLSGQNEDKKGGEFEFGFRNTVSLFSAESQMGFGAGSQFRLRLGNRLNTEWYADLLKNNIDDLGSRTDSHIGWSVMFYPKWYKAKVNPYFIAGHCFDYTKVVVFGSSTETTTKVDRWSSAVQMGLGTSLHLTEKINVSFAGQYMMHLGGDIHTDTHEHFGTKVLHATEENGTGMEGHLLITLSINMLISDLWSKEG